MGMSRPIMQNMEYGILRNTATELNPNPYPIPLLNQQP